MLYDQSKFMKTYFYSILCTLLSSLSLVHFGNNYEIIEDYNIRFSTDRAAGTFRGLTGRVEFDTENIENSTMDVAVSVSTIKTGNKTKDKHARKSKWFDAKKYPSISFKSNSIAINGNQYTANGVLTIKDVSEETEIDFTVESDDEVPYLIGSMIINREQYNINGNSFAFLVGEDVTVDLRIPANYTN